MRFKIPALVCGAVLCWRMALVAQTQVSDEPAAALLKANCTPCHDEKSRTSGLSVITLESLLKGGARHGASVVPGNPDASPLIQTLRGTLTPRMPFGKPAFTSEQIEQIARWIREVKPSAAALTTSSKKWWAFELPVKTSPVPVNTQWARNEIDRFVLAKLTDKRLTPSQDASPRILLRRAFLDLVGIPPSPEQADLFLNDQSPDAYEKLLDRLLADPRFGQRWGRHWLDLARYADTQGFEADKENYHMWRYRDYVIDSFNKDKSYDLFMKEQIAGDELAQQSSEARTATGFLRLGPRFQSTNAQELRQMALDEITGTVTSV